MLLTIPRIWQSEIFRSILDWIDGMQNDKKIRDESIKDATKLCTKSLLFS